MALRPVRVGLAGLDSAATVASRSMSCSAAMRDLTRHWTVNRGIRPISRSDRPFVRELAFRPSGYLLTMRPPPTLGVRWSRSDERLRVIVADDERPARAFLAGMLREFEDVEVIGEAASGAECVELIEKLSPDLVLLDLQMPEVDGLGVVRLVRREKLPLIAFVTAYDEYAVRAFEMNAVDYLLKPVDPTRLRATINRAMERLERAELRPGDAERVRAAASRVRGAAAAGAAPANSRAKARRHLPRSRRAGRVGRGRRRVTASHRRERATGTRSPTGSRISRRGSIPRSSSASRAGRCSTSR